MSCAVCWDWDVCQVWSVGLVGVVFWFGDMERGRVDEAELEDDEEEMVDGVL